MVLVDYIGKPAMLEQTAEEANELAFACLKLARYMRGENMVHGRTPEELFNNLEEEIADIFVCIEEVSHGGLINNELVNDWIERKKRRMAKRLKEADYEQ